jgi:hypothetical protein
MEMEIVLLLITLIYLVQPFARWQPLTAETKVDLLKLSTTVGGDSFRKQFGWTPRYPSYREGLQQTVETWGPSAGWIVLIPGNVGAELEQYLDLGFLCVLKFKYCSNSQAIARSLFNHEYIKSYLENKLQKILD